MTIDEVKDMLPQKPEKMLPVAEPKKSELVKACYELVGCLGVLLISRLVGYYAKAAWATGIADTYRRYRVGRVFSKGKARVFHYSKADSIKKFFLSP